jgi:hypothetical protein
MKHFEHNLSLQQRSSCVKELQRSLSDDERETARQQVLDGLFWELTYWKTPELYEALTEGSTCIPVFFSSWSRTCVATLYSTLEREVDVPHSSAHTLGQTDLCRRAVTWPVAYPAAKTGEPGCFWSNRRIAGLR